MLHWSESTQFDQSAAIEEIVFFVNRLLEGTPSARLLVGEDGFGRSMLLDLARQQAMSKQAAILTLSVRPDAARGWEFASCLAAGMHFAGREGRAALIAMLDDLFRSLQRQAQRVAKRGGCDADGCARRRLDGLRSVAGGALLSQNLLCAWQDFCASDQGLAEAVQTAGLVELVLRPLAALDPADQLVLVSALCQTCGAGGLLVILEGATDASLLLAFETMDALLRPVAVSSRFALRMGVLAVANPTSLQQRQNQMLMQIGPHGMRARGEEGANRIAQINRLSIKVPSLGVADYVPAKAS